MSKAQDPKVDKYSNPAFLIKSNHIAIPEEDEKQA